MPASLHLFVPEQSAGTELGGMPTRHMWVRDELISSTPRRSPPVYTSRCTEVGEKAGRQTAMYSAPSASGVL